MIDLHIDFGVWPRSGILQSRFYENFNSAASVLRQIWIGREEIKNAFQIKDTIE